MRRRRAAAAHELERRDRRVIVDARWSGDRLLRRRAVSRVGCGESTRTPPRPGRGSPIADIPAAAMYPSISRPTPGQPARLAFQTIMRDVDLQLMDLEPRPVNDTIESKPFSNSTRIEGSARFSPDGSRIAFASFRSGAPEIWVAGRDGSGLQQLTTLGARGLLLGGWSPDGSTIAFEAAVAGNTDVYLVGADGGHLRRLTAEPSMDGVPSWSADGQWIYFASTRAGVIPDVWRVSPDGGEPIRVTHDGGFEPQESPDGRYLFYLDRHPAACDRSDGQADARTARRRTAGTGARTRSAVSVVGHRYRDRVRHPRAGLRRDRCVPVQRSADRPRRPARISDTGDLHAHDGLARRTLGTGDEDGAIRFRSHAARQLSMENSAQCDHLSIRPAKESSWIWDSYRDEEFTFRIEPRSNPATEISCSQDSV